MKKRIVFIADHFVEDGIHGGAEICNDELINLLHQREIYTIKLRSHKVSPQIISDYSDDFFVIANFMNLTDVCKESLADKRYIIYEHDHKYVNTNDPSKFVNMNVPSEAIINKNFYERAMAVLCQSKIHSRVLQKNLIINNVINLGGNLWSDEKLNFLEKNITDHKTVTHSIIASRNKNKGTPTALKYCAENNIIPEKIFPASYEDFIKKIAISEYLIFFPQWLESFNRVSIEARILGCKLITNSLIGAASEDWFREMRGKDLLPFLRKKREEIVSTFVDLYKAKERTEVESYFIPLEIPKISIITSLYKGKEHIQHFMEEIVKQTIFDQCELIILDANSPDNEYEEVIEKYLQTYSNIRYTRLNNRLTVQETMNLGIDMSTGDYITLANIDDTRSYNALEKLGQALFLNDKIDLVYADCYQTDKPNETHNSNSSSGKLYGHSIYDFSSPNMIKCLPGPMPMWRKSLNDKHGKFNTKLKFAGDWEMWLRCVRGGAMFKKIPYVLGLYYNNPEGLSTSNLGKTERFAEERALFYEYKDLFGEKVFNTFRGYFK